MQLAKELDNRGSLHVEIASFDVLLDSQSGLLIHVDIFKLVYILG